MTFVCERYRSFNNDPAQTIAVLGRASGRDYEVDAQLMIAERNLALPTDWNHSASRRSRTGRL